jgi:hypothetical protein
MPIAINKKRSVQDDPWGELHWYQPSWGTWLQGYLYYVSYSQLVEAFGKPKLTDAGARWTVNTPDGEADIYNWDEDKRPPEEIDIWHVVARSREPYEWVRDILKWQKTTDRAGRVVPSKK